MTRSSGHAFQIIRKGVSTLFLLCLSAGLLSCGGGPEVASSTGHYLFVSNSNGIYAFSIQTNNTLSPVSTSAEQSLSGINGMVYVATPGGQTTPMLYVIINDGTTIDAYPVNGGSIGTPTSVKISNCPVSPSFTAITATPGGHYLLLTYGSSVVAINLSGATTANSCTTASSSLFTSTPSGIAVDCAVPTGSPCNVLTTFSTAPPEVVSWTEGGSFGASPTTLSNITTNPPYPLFSLSTTYFYLFSPTKTIVSSLLGSSTTSSPTSSQTISSTSVSPCLDTLANQIYVPTSNGSIYQMGIQTNGSISGANQLWNLGDTPALDSIGTCAVED